MLKNILILLLVLLVNIGHSQNRRDKYKDIEKYIPYNLSSYKRFPIKTINVKVHVLYRTENQLENIKLKDSNKIHNMFRSINYMYSNFEPPTLKIPSSPPNITSSRINFNVVKIDGIVDSSLFSFAKLEESSAYGSPWNVDSINVVNNLIILKTRAHNLIKVKPKGMDSIVYYDTNNNRSFLHFDTSFYKQPYTYVKIKESLKDLDVSKVAYLRVKSSICNDDLYEKYFVQDSSHLHIFLTGDDSKPISSGCGPSPVFLKLSHFYKSNYKLLGHEIGHCLGLYHTNTPQFDDLPIKEGFYGKCDTISVSNNIMGYNWCRNYLSPKQIGHIYKEYNTNPVKIKTTTDCSYDEKRILRINKNMEYNRAVAYGGDIIIKKKKELTIYDKFSLPKGAHIYIEKKAKLTIDGGSIYNACGENWEGIIFVKKYKKKKMKIMDEDTKRFIQKNGGTIENLAY